MQKKKRRSAIEEFRKFGDATLHFSWAVARSSGHPDVRRERPDSVRLTKITKVPILGASFSGKGPGVSKGPRGRTFRTIGLRLRSRDAGVLPRKSIVRPAAAGKRENKGSGAPETVVVSEAPLSVCLSAGPYFLRLRGGNSAVLRWLSRPMGMPMPAVT